MQNNTDRDTRNTVVVWWIWYKCWSQDDIHMVKYAHEPYAQCHLGGGA